jgi:multiple antibiotic resistance protein
MEAFLLCFVPLFVAVDAVGLLPLYISLTEPIDVERRQRVLVQSLLTAGAVAIGFLIVGPALLRFLGITISDFMIAGGLLLLAISLTNLITGERRHGPSDDATLGAVPLGVPLITGPAVLTTSLLLADQHGQLLTGLALVVNMAFAGMILAVARPITRWLGVAGIKTLSKIASMLLATIAVMLIRKGLQIALHPG